MCNKQSSGGDVILLLKDPGVVGGGQSPEEVEPLVRHARLFVALPAVIPFGPSSVLDARRVDNVADIGRQLQLARHPLLEQSTGLVDGAGQPEVNGRFEDFALQETLDVRAFGRPSQDAVKRRDEVTDETVEGATGRPDGEDRVQLAQMSQGRGPGQVFRFVDEVLAQCQRDGDVQDAGPGERKGVVNQLGTIGRTERRRLIGQHPNERLPNGRLVVDAVIAAGVDVGFNPRDVHGDLEVHCEIWSASF